MNRMLEIKRNRDVVATEDLQMIYRVGKVEVPALRGVDLVVKQGEFMAVMGPSGCGKSTLLHLMGGLLSPSSGRIFIDGVDISSVKDSERTDIRRRKIGFVFQQYNLLPTLSAKDNIELAKRLNGNEFLGEGNTHTVLRLLGLENKVHHKPYELSGGEQQRVAIARALASEPLLLLADEPTGNLDDRATHGMMELFWEINAMGMAVLMATHDLELVRRYPSARVLELDQGRLVYDSDEKQAVFGSAD